MCMWLVCRCDSLWRLTRRLGVIRKAECQVDRLGQLERTGRAEELTCRIMAQAGADVIFLDWEHTPMGTSMIIYSEQRVTILTCIGIREVVNLIKLLQTAGEGRTAVVVRYVGRL